MAGLRCFANEKLRCTQFPCNDAAAKEIYTLSLHDALPISLLSADRNGILVCCGEGALRIVSLQREGGRDRKSTRLNSSHMSISYAVFCLKKKTHARRDCAPFRIERKANQRAAAADRLRRIG